MEHADLQVGSALAGEFAVEHQDVVSFAGLRTRSVDVLQEFRALVLGVDVDGAGDVPSVVLVRVSAVYHFERGDVSVELASDQSRQGRRRDRLQILVPTLRQRQTKRLAEVADQVWFHRRPLHGAHDTLFGGGDRALERRPDDCWHRRLLFVVDHLQLLRVGRTVELLRRLRPLERAQIAGILEQARPSPTAIRCGPVMLERQRSAEQRPDHQVFGRCRLHHRPLLVLVLIREGPTDQLAEILRQVVLQRLDI